MSFAREHLSGYGGYGTPPLDALEVFADTTLKLEVLADATLKLQAYT